MFIYILFFVAEIKHASIGVVVESGFFFVLSLCRVIFLWNFNCVDSLRMCADVALKIYIARLRKTRTRFTRILYLRKCRNEI